MTYHSVETVQEDNEHYENYKLVFYMTMTHIGYRQKI